GIESQVFAHKRRCHAHRATMRVTEEHRSDEKRGQPPALRQVFQSMRRETNFFRRFIRGCGFSTCQHQSFSYEVESGVAVKGGKRKGVPFTLLLRGPSI